MMVHQQRFQSINWKEFGTWTDERSRISSDKVLDAVIMLH
jgi:hypothetical protein